MMIALRLSLLFAVLLSCTEGRAKFGKLSLRANRQVNQRDYSQFSSHATGEQYVHPAQHVQPIQAEQLVQPVQPIQQVQPVESVSPAYSEGRQYQYRPQPLSHAVPQNIYQQVTSNTPQNSQLIGARQVFAPQPISTGGYGQQPVVTAPLPPPGSLLSKLISNATVIRPNIVEGFSCEGKKYGYYADVANECQIFHVCFPLRDVFQNDPAASTVPDITYHFSFICNSGLKFSQAALTCGWAYEVEPCEMAPQLYDRSNQDFFKIPASTAAPAYGAAVVPVNVPQPVPGGAYPTPGVIRG